MKVPRNIDPPAIRPMGELKLPPFVKYELPNGIPVIEVFRPERDLVKLEFAWFAGRPFEQKKLASRATAALLMEGSGKYSQEEIAEKMDYYGAAVKSWANMDFAFTRMFCMGKHAPKLFPVLMDVLLNPQFPEEELTKFKRLQKDRLKQELRRPEFIAYREFTEMLFGSEHPYGYNSEPKMYDDLNRSDLIDHYKTAYALPDMILLAGNITTDLRKDLTGAFETLPVQIEKREPELPTVEPNPFKKRVAHKQAVQSSIRIGRNGIYRENPDYAGLYFVNTILGGFFGSRLMREVREKQGLTYHIQSSIDPMLFEGYFHIDTEVNADKEKEAIEAIYRQIDALASDPIPPEELEMIRNYLLGHFLHFLDGPFHFSELLKVLHLEGVGISFFEELIHTIKSINGKEINGLVEKYLNPKLMSELIVGMKSVHSPF